MYKVEFRKSGTVGNILIGRTPVDTLREARIFAKASIRKAYTSHRVSFMYGHVGSFGAYWGTEFLGTVTITKV